MPTRGRAHPGKAWDQGSEEQENEGGLPECFLTGQKAGTLKSLSWWPEGAGAALLPALLSENKEASAKTSASQSTTELICLYIYIYK